jgi:hypothetical protein
VVTAQLFGTLDEAFAAKKEIDDTGCGGRCTKAHAVYCLGHKRCCIVVLDICYVIT